MSQLSWSMCCLLTALVCLPTTPLTQEEVESQSGHTAGVWETGPNSVPGGPAVYVLATTSPVVTFYRASVTVTRRLLPCRRLAPPTEILIPEAWSTEPRCVLHAVRPRHLMPPAGNLPVALRPPPRPPLFTCMWPPGLWLLSWPLDPHSPIWQPVATCGC